jgi:CheY-like chemotaxis protein
MELKRVLFVDDDEGIRRVAQITLTRIGKLDVLLAKSGKEALELLQSERPDLILLDVMMPGMDGPAVLEKLRQNPDTASIPVIFLTAKIQKHEVEEYSQLGACGVISKPFEPTELAEQVRQLYNTFREVRK